MCFSCAEGFEGTQCRRLRFDAIHKGKESESTTSIAVWIVVGCLVTIFVMAILFMIYR